MNLPKGETRQELLNRAFLYVIIIAFSVLIFLRVKSLIFDLFVAVVLAALAEPVVYRLTKKINRQSAALVAVLLILLVIGATLFSIIPIMVQEIYFLSSQMPTYFDNFINYLNVEGFAVSIQSLDLENQFNSLIKDYGSTVGSSVVFAGQGLLRTLGHIFIIFFFTYYLISEGDGWRVKLKESLPSNVSSSIDQVWRIGVSKAGGFIVAKVILGVLASIVLAVSFSFCFTKTLFNAADFLQSIDDKLSPCLYSLNCQKSSPLPEVLDACKPSMIFLERIEDSNIILGKRLAYSSDALNKSDIFIILILSMVNYII